jgi:energy-converting hydrogenase B subunit D
VIGFSVLMAPDVAIAEVAVSAIAVPMVLLPVIYKTHGGGDAERGGDR